MGVGEASRFAYCGNQFEEAKRDASPTENLTQLPGSTEVGLQWLDASDLAVRRGVRVRFYPWHKLLTALSEEDIDPVIACVVGIPRKGA
jgi:hypothetical protein